MSEPVLHYGMIGGGQRSFIGAVHRTAIQMERGAQLAAGVFSSDATRSRQFGKELGLSPDRVYGSCEELVLQESRRPAKERLDFVSLVAPTALHAPAAVMLLEHGFNVVCEKPLACTLAEASALESAVSKSGKVFVLTHNYTGNAMVKHARELVRDGALGDIRKVCVEYLQGWRARLVPPREAPRDAARPNNVGTGCLPEIGSHAYNLLTYVTGLRAERVCADLNIGVAGRAHHDDAMVMIRTDSNTPALIHCSQIALGEENNLNIRVYGDRASLAWFQEAPNELHLKYYDRPSEIRRRGNFYTGTEAGRFTRLPPGHAEGYLEAFANLYREALRAVRAERAGEPMPANLDMPGIREGVEGTRFVAAALLSADRGGVWCDVQDRGV